MLVCGGRDYWDVQSVMRVLNGLHQEEQITMIIHGGQSGADQLAALWARINGVFAPNFAIEPRVWDREGRRIGPIRNRVMLELTPDKVLAFPGGRGTMDMMSAAQQASVPVLVYDDMADEIHRQ